MTDPSPAPAPDEAHSEAPWIAWDPGTALRDALAAKLLDRVAHVDARAVVAALIDDLTPSVQAHATRVSQARTAHLRADLNAALAHLDAALAREATARRDSGVAALRWVADDWRRNAAEGPAEALDIATAQTIDDYADRIELGDVTP